MKIPFSPPFIDHNVISQVLNTLETKWITSGPKVKALEQEISEFTGSKASVCVNSWTSGAILMLKWFGIKEGDEVIVPAYTYCATALSVIHCGATPVIVDITDDFTIDPEEVQKAITPRTKAIIAVDIAGLPCNYNKLNSIIREPEIQDLFNPQSEKQAKLGRILLISDAAHSIGALYNGVSAALAADITIYSFHAVKNITSAEGGCVCLNLPEIFDTKEEYNFLKIFSLNGQNKDAFTKTNGGGWRYDILYAGLKINMPDICAAIALAQLRQYKDSLLPSRRKVATRYYKGFRFFNWFVPPLLRDRDRETSYHIFPIRIKNITEEQRDRIIDRLMANEIIVNVHFIPLPMLTLFKNMGYKIEDYPNAYKQFSSEISLPIYPQLTDAELDYIIQQVIEAVQIEVGEEDTLMEQPVYSI